MIKNLSIYSDWKRSTLDRLTDKYRRLYMAVYRQHLMSLAITMEQALKGGVSTINVTVDAILPDLSRVVRAHQHHVVYTAVSDGIREVDPEKHLSSWEKFPYWFPVEETFISLAERSLRDRIFQTVKKTTEKKNRSLMAEIISLDTRRYMKNVKALFAGAAKAFFEQEDTTDTKDTVKDLLKRALHLTDSHAETMFRTETTRYFNDARISYFQTNTDVDFVRIVAITDGRISDICESRANYVIPISKSNLPEFKPPFHPNCRSVVSPLVTVLSSASKVVQDNLGSEFGTVVSSTSDKSFVGKRKPPLPLPPSNLRWKHA
jgi:SPP1 gp7 family putative phage head morphogenesis protein